MRIIEGDRVEAGEQWRTVSEVYIKAVEDKLFDYASQFRKGSLWVTVATLASACKISPRQIDRCLKALELRCKITRGEKRKDRHGNWISTVTTLKGRLLKRLHGYLQSLKRLDAFKLSTAAVDKDAETAPADNVFSASPYAPRAHKRDSIFTSKDEDRQQPTANAAAEPNLLDGLTAMERHWLSNPRNPETRGSGRVPIAPRRPVSTMADVLRNAAEP